jgi:hypothetical protein
MTDVSLFMASSSGHATREPRAEYMCPASRRVVDPSGKKLESKNRRERRAVINRRGQGKGDDEDA